MSKKTLCVDFDGVIHSYTSGWKGACNIPDPPVPGAIDFLVEALAAGYDVVIHSTRARHWFGPMAMRRWLRKWAGEQWDTEAQGMGIPCLMDVRFARWKPAAMVTLDDRAVRFEGTFPNPRMLMNLRPWNKL